MKTVTVDAVKDTLRREWDKCQRKGQDERTAALEVLERALTDALVWYADEKRPASGVRIPRRFFEDHVARDLPTPAVVKETKRHVWVDPHDPAIGELLSDARYYAEEARYMDPPMPGLAASARATLDALRAYDKELR